MNDLDLDKILRDTLDDFRVSRGEKKSLRKIVQKWQQDGQLAWLRSRAFEIAVQELIDPQTKQVVRWLEEIVKLLTPTIPPDPTDADVLFSPDDRCSARIQSQIKSASKTVDVCVFTITDNRISAELLAAHQRGILVRIVTDDDKASDLGSDVDDFRRVGIEVRTDDSPFHMHHKFAIVDQRILLTGSYNWTLGAARNNEENLIITNDPRLVDRFASHFESLWQKLA